MEAEQIFERRIRWIQRSVFWALGILLICGITTVFIPINEYYRAYGKVVPEDEAIIYALEDCAVEQVLVRSGDRVTSGQVLALFSTLDLDAEKLALQNEADRLDAQIASQVLEKEKVLKNPLTPEFRHIEIDRQTAEARLKHINEYLGMLDELAKEGIVSKLEYNQAKLTQAQAEADLKRDNINREVLQKGYAETLLRSADSQVRLLETQRKSIERQKAHLEERYARRRVLAPASGILVQAEKRDPGEPVRKGEVLFRIALSDRVLIRLMGPEQNVNRVSVGQPVLIESLVFSPYKYGYAHGEVLKVAKDAETGESGAEGTPAAQPLYRIYCSVTDKPEKQSLPLGSSVSAKISLRRSNLLFILLGWGNLQE